MRSLALILCVALVGASSYPDKTNCEAEDLEGLEKNMKWVLPAVRTDAYTLRTGDGCAGDATTYIPGQFVSIHLRTHKYKGQFRGLLLYAVDLAGNRVGDWHFDWPNSNMFWKPLGACQNKSLMHLDGAEKYYHHEFKFEAPPTGTGTIEFKTLIKRGQANTGEFYYPNLQGNLKLDELRGAASATTYVQGLPGSSCSIACATVSKVCDAALLSQAYKWAGYLQRDVTKQVGCNYPALASDTAKIVTKDAKGWCTYPSPLVGEFAAACDAVAPAGSVPLCPCGTAGVPSFGPSVPPPDTACLNALMAMGSASKTSSNALSFLLILFSGVFLNQHKPSNLLLTLVCVLFCAYTVQAHNWVYQISRSFNQASTYKPCRPKVNDVPHWQINQKQEFTMEWATGHDHYFYFTVVHADDILLLENTTQNDLDNYIKICVAGDDYRQTKTADGMRWAKQHMNTDYKAITTAIDPVTQEQIYSRNISNTTAEWIHRHEKFGMFNNEVRWIYKDKYTNMDKRCSYFNPSLPYIVAVHRFVQVDTVMSRAGDRDIARFTIDLSPGHILRHGLSGQYLIQYLWRGYFDCADVELFPDSMPVLAVGGRKLTDDEPQWNKVDHCQYEEIQEVRTDCQEVVTNAYRCLDDCAGDNGCSGVNVVPRWLPSTVYPLFSNRVGVPWDDRRCLEEDFAGLGRGAKICHGLLARLPNNTHAEYSVTDDPEDPLFYATCFIKRSRWTFDLKLENSSAIVPVPPPWSYADRCVDCMEWKASQENFDVPSWILPEFCVDCDNAVLGPVPKLPGSLVARGAKCDGSFATKTRWHYQKVAPACESQRCVKQLSLVGTGGEITAEECIAKAKADIACSEFVQYRGKGRGNACECFIKDDCCGTCVPVDTNFSHWEWNIYSTKKQSNLDCATGVKSSDNKYCCSATCKDASGVGLCMPAPALQVNFLDDSMNITEGWASDNGAIFGVRTNPGYTTPYTSYGWNCDLRLATEDRSSEDGTNYHSTVVRPDSGRCAGAIPKWRVAVPDGQYQVDTLFTKRFSSIRGCKIQGENNYDANKTGLGDDDVEWVSRLVTATNGEIALTGGTNEQCAAYAAVLIYPKSTVPSDSYCQGLPGTCCPLFVDMENRPCSQFEPPCKL